MSSPVQSINQIITQQIYLTKPATHNKSWFPGGLLRVWRIVNTKGKELNEMCQKITTCALWKYRKKVYIKFLNNIKPTIFRRYLSRSPTVVRGSIFNVLPVLSINEPSPAARSNWNRSRLASTWETIRKQINNNWLRTCQLKEVV